MESKICSDCTKDLPLNSDFYYKNKTAPDGFNPYCKECTKQRSQKWKDNNREKVKEWDNNYLLNPKRKEDLRKNATKQRKAGKQREWRRNNKDKIREYNLYRDMNKKHEITEKEWEVCKSYFSHSCAYCGITEDDAKAEQGQYLHMEHAMNNGSDKIDNCIPSCKSCNSHKWKHDYIDWYTEGNPKYDQERMNKIVKWLKDDYKIVNQIHTI